MKRLKFKTEHGPMCLYCKHSRAVALTDDMLCAKKGIVPREGRCRKYAYDLLKRTPRRRLEPDFSRFAKEDFTV
jgi:hypothetical protein